MKSISKIFLFLVLFLSDKSCFSQSLGCQSGTSVYTQQGLLGVWFGTPLSTGCGPLSTSSTLYAGNVRPLPGAPQPCNIRLLGGSGTLVNYDTLNCSLDQYIFMLFLPIVSLAIWKIKSLA